jgi:hypothetical protein
MLHNVLLAREDFSALAPEEEGDEADICSGAMQSRGDGATVEEVDERAVAMRCALAATVSDWRTHI